MAKNYVLIPAAGSGSRMGSDYPKQYLPLLGKPLVHHTLSVFSRHALVEKICVLIAPDDAIWTSCEDVPPLPKCEVLRCGGRTRAATVLNGLRALQADDDDWVLVHDAARPCMTPELLDRLFAALAGDPVGGLLAVPVADTLKRADAACRVAATEPREGLWQAQTPQMFRYGLLKRALEALGTDMPTDEAQAIEHLGLAPRLVPGERTNLKVTFPEDMEMARMLLQARATI